MKLALPVSCAVLLLIAGCAVVPSPPPASPAVRVGIIASLRSGKLALTCGLGCRAAWNARRSAIQTADLAERWRDVATQVITIGYDNDLAYYYLGQAAQGLGYHRAAIVYYDRALALDKGANASVRCEASSGFSGDSCQGVDIAKSVPVLLAASRTVLAEQAVNTHRSAHRRHAAPPPTPTADAGPGWLTPPPEEPGTGTSGLEPSSATTDDD